MDINSVRCIHTCRPICMGSIYGNVFDCLDYETPATDKTMHYL